jgi:hypothetical protein
MGGPKRKKVVLGADIFSRDGWPERRKWFSASPRRKEHLEEKPVICADLSMKRVSGVWTFSGRPNIDSVRRDLHLYSQ